jgi:hypothetical protein
VTLCLQVAGKVYRFPRFLCRRDPHYCLIIVRIVKERSGNKFCDQTGPPKPGLTRHQSVPRLVIMIPRLFIISLALAFAISAAPVLGADSTYTDASYIDLRLMGGGGSFTGYSSEDNTPDEDERFGDFGAAIFYQTASDFGVGFQLGYADDHRVFGDGTGSPSGSGFWFFTPHVSLQPSWIGITAGMLMTTRELYDGDVDGSEDRKESNLYPSFTLRIGKARRPHLFAGIYHSFPVYSGGGYFDGGVVLPYGNESKVYVGVNALGMTRNPGVTIQLQTPTRDTVFFDLSAKASWTEDRVDTALAGGFTWRFARN